MAEKKFKAVNSSESAGIRFIRPSELAKEGFTGTALEGVYLEAIPNQIDDTKLDYKFEEADGTIAVLNGAGNLGYQMQKVSVGALVRVDYAGKQLITKGPRKGKEAHNFTVLVESED